MNDIRIARETPRYTLPTSSEFGVNASVTSKGSAGRSMYWICLKPYMAASGCMLRGSTRKRSGVRRDEINVVTPWGMREEKVKMGAEGYRKKRVSGEEETLADKRSGPGSQRSDRTVQSSTSPWSRHAQMAFLVSLAPIGICRRSRTAHPGYIPAPLNRFAATVVVRLPLARNRKPQLIQYTVCVTKLMPFIPLSKKLSCRLTHR